MYCGNCGAKVDDKAKFCPACGKKLRDAPVPVDHPPVPGPSLWDIISTPFIWLMSKIALLLKKPTFAKLIKICVGVLVVVLLAAIIGNTAGGYDKKVLGDWYEEGSSMLEFSLYDDGSSKVGNSLQKGKWSIVNKDQLHISTHWGQNRIFTIISAGGGKLVLAQHYAGGPGTMDAVTFWHTPHK